MKRILKIILLFLVATVFTLFVFGNTEIITIKFFVWEIKIRLFLLIIFTFLFGLVFANCINYFKNLFLIKEYKTKIKELKNEK